MENEKICLDKSIVSFLCNVYFGEDEDIERSIQRAYLDFNRTIAFNNEHKEMQGDSKEEKKNKLKKRSDLRDKALHKIKTFIEEKLLTIECQDAFDTEHKVLCRDISEIYKSKTCISHKKREINPDGLYYGQAQKWVNMTMKYIYVLDKCKGGIQYDNVVSLFHVPVDNIILNEPDENVHVERIRKEKESWSTWDYNTYMSYREKLEEQIKTCYGEDKAPLIWEIENWVPKKNT